MNPGGSSSKSKLIIGVLIPLLIGAGAFGYWAYKGRQDYKSNVDQKVSAAIGLAQAQQKANDDTANAQANKSPNSTYKGSATYGSVTFNYPKTWSGYVDDSNSSEPINGYFFPGIVPSVQGSTAFALRVELVTDDYSDVAHSFDADISQGNLTAKAYIPPQMQKAPNVQPGLYLDGTVGHDSQGNAQQGQMVIIKVRDKTLKIYTQTKDYSADFNNTILATLTFAP